MQKLLHSFPLRAAVCVAVIIGTASCATRVSQNVASYVLDKQCHTELEKRRDWQLFSAVLPQETKKRWENEICTCAADETAKQMKFGDVVKLADQSEREKAIANIGVRTVAQCTKKLLSK